MEQTNDYVSLKLIDDDSYLIHNLPLKKIYHSGSSIKNRLHNLYEYAFILINKAVDEGLFFISIPYLDDEIMTALEEKMKQLGYQLIPKRKEKKYLISWNHCLQEISTMSDMEIKKKKTYRSKSYYFKAWDAACFSLDILIEASDEITALLLDQLKEQIYFQLLLPLEERKPEFTLDLGEMVLHRGMSMPISIFTGIRTYQILRDAEKLELLKISNYKSIYPFYEESYKNIYAIEERFKMPIPESYRKIKIYVNTEYMYQKKEKNEDKKGE